MGNNESPNRGAKRDDPSQGKEPEKFTPGQQTKPDPRQGQGGRSSHDSESSSSQSGADKAKRRNSDDDEKDEKDDSAS